MGGSQIVLALWQAIIAFFGGPVISGLLNAYNSYLKAHTADVALATDLAAKEIAAQTAEMQQQYQYRMAELGYWHEPDKLMGYAVAIYFGKLLVWDKCLGLGVTDPLAGFAANTANLIVIFYFAKRGIENVFKILKLK